MLGWGFVKGWGGFGVRVLLIGWGEGFGMRCVKGWRRFWGEGFVKGRENVGVVFVYRVIYGNIKQKLLIFFRPHHLWKHNFK